MDKLSCMHAFVTVLEAQGFSAAARRLGVSKALISKQVNQLEEHLKVRLLNRTTRRISATSTGQAYFEQCQPLLAELEELDDAVQSNNTNPQGELQITAPITFAELYLMPIILNFCKQFPKLKMKIDLTDRFVDLIEERIDVAIRIGSLTDSSLIARKLGSMTMLVCASPDFLDKNGEPFEPQQLKDYCCITDRNYPGLNHWDLGSGVNVASVEVESNIVVNSARVAREYVLAGHGIGLLPSFVIMDDIHKGKVKHILSNYPSESLGIYAVYPHRKHLSAKVRLFIDAVLKQGEISFSG